MKRSISPSTHLGPDEHSLKWRLVRVFSAIKDVFTLPKPTPALPMDSNTSQNDIDANIPTAFVSRKRQNSVIESLRLASQAVPRASLSVQHPSTRYETVSDYLRTEQQTFNGNVLPNLDDALLGGTKEVSPSVYVPRNPILPMDPMEPMEMMLEGDEQTPFTGGDEYSPLYCDEEGNLVRPPFINLDPRERYQMLKLKKSVEVSEHLRNTMKYMVDPDETVSINRPNNKVDCSTQTHNLEYLDKTLHFSALRKKLALKNRKQRNTHKAKGFFSGSFSYDPVETQAPIDQGSSMKGFLGDLSVPKFPAKISNLQEELLPDQDHEPSFKLKKKLSERAGLENALRTGKATSDPSSSELATDVKPLSSLIQVKETPTLAKKSTTGPSSGFKFDIDKKAIAPILSQNDQATSILFGSTAPRVNVSEKSKLSSYPLAVSDLQPQETLFSRTTPDEDDEARVRKKSRPVNEDASKPKLNFAPDTHSKSFSSSSTKQNTGTSSSPSFQLFGSKPADATKNSIVDPPKFSFGTTEAASTKTSITAKPAFSLSCTKPDLDETSSFGSTALKEKNDSKPLFSFGQPSDNSSFLFSSKAKEDSSKTNSASTLNFGSKIKDQESKTQNTDKATPSTFSFGASANNSSGPSLFGAASKSAPVGLFGAKSDATGQAPGSNSTLFGSSSEKTAGESKTPTLSFGKTASSTTDSPAPAFSFGQTATKLDNKPKDDNSTSAVSESEKQSKPSFLFGSAKPDALSAAKPSLFGQSESTDTKPSSSTGGLLSSKGPGSTAFGAVSSPLTSGLKPSNSFSDAPSAAMSKPAVIPSFGQSLTSTPQPEAPKIAFNFGASSSADPAAIFGGGGNAPAPAFSFSVDSLSKPSTPVAPFGQPAAQKTGGFSFSSKALGGISSASTTSLPSGFGFGASTQNNTSLMTSNGNPGFGGFGNNPAPNNAFGNGSKSGTPSVIGNHNNGFNFGGNMQQNQFQPTPFGNNAAQKASTFGGHTPQPSFGGHTPQPSFGDNNSQGGFNFSSNVAGVPSFGTSPNNFGPGSREATPSGFGGSAGPGDMSGQPFVPPIANISNRKIAQMRQRKRY